MTKHLITSASDFVCQCVCVCVCVCALACHLLKVANTEGKCLHKAVSYWNVIPKRNLSTGFTVGPVSFNAPKHIILS